MLSTMQLPTIKEYSAMHFVCVIRNTKMKKLNRTKIISEVFSFFICHFYFCTLLFNFLLLPVLVASSKVNHITNPLISWLLYDLQIPL